MRVSLVEEMVMNPNFFSEEMKGWRAYRIEYGGIENSNREGMIYLPPDVNTDVIEMVLNIFTDDELPYTLKKI